MSPQTRYDDVLASLRGPLPGDDRDPPRFFFWRTDEQLQQFTQVAFDTVDFHVVPVHDRRFQSLTLRRRPLNATR